MGVGVGVGLLRTCINHHCSVLFQTVCQKPETMSHWVSRYKNSLFNNILHLLLGALFEFWVPTRMCFFSKNYWKYKVCFEFGRCLYCWRLSHAVLVRTLATTHLVIKPESYCSPTEVRSESWLFRLGLSVYYDACGLI